MILLPLLLAASPLLSGSENEPSEAGPNVLQVYDLASVLPQLDASTKWQERLVVSSASFWEYLPSYSGELQNQGGAEVVLELLTQMIGDELRLEGRRLGLEGDDRLAVLAPEEVHARVRQALDFLRDTLTGRVELTVDVLTIQGAPGGGELPGGLLEPVAADQLINAYLGRGAAHRTFTVGLAAGRTAKVDELRRTSFLWDYDVEIAQGAVVFDPIVADAERGLRLLLRGVPVEGGLFLSLLYRDSQLVGEVETRELQLRGTVSREDSGGIQPVSGPQVFQEADVLFRSAAIDTFLPEKKALVLASETDLPNAQTSQILVLRRTGGDLASYAVSQTGGSKALLLVNTEMLSPPSFDVGTSPWVADEYGIHPLLGATLTAEPSIFLFDWMKSRFSAWRRLGPWALAATSPEWDSGSTEELQALVKSIRHEAVVRTVQLDLGSRSAGGKTPVRFNLPVRLGSQAAAACGVTGQILLDYNVEVAQFASVGDPVRPPTFDGLAAGLRVAASRAGVDLELRLRGARALRPGAPLDLGDRYNLGLVEPSDRLGLVLEERLALTPGATVVVGDSGSGDRGPSSLHVTASVR